MVKKLNGFLLTRKLNRKCLAKVRPFSLSKVRFMHDHVKPTVRDFIRDHIILHWRTNEQLARFPDPLKKDNQISISFITSRNDNLNSKASEVNSRLLHMCAERNIPYIDNTNSIQQGNHPYESKFHLNRFGKITFAKFLSEYY